MGPTLYDVVGALRDASPSMLKRAYRLLVCYRYAKFLVAAEKAPDC